MQVGTTNINLYHASIYARYDAHLTCKQHTLCDIQTVIKKGHNPINWRWCTTNEFPFKEINKAFVSLVSPYESR